MYTEEKKLTQEEISWRQFNKYVKTALIRKRKDYLQKKARIMKHEMHQDPETILLYKCDRRNDRDFEELFQDDTDILTLDIENKRLQQALNCLNQREYYVVITYTLKRRTLIQLAEDLGIKYKSAAAVYYRAMDKLRREMVG